MRLEIGLAASVHARCVISSLPLPKNTFDSSFFAK